MKKWFEKLKYLLPVIGSLLGSLGGQGLKFLRRFILSVVLGTLGFLDISWWGLLLGTFGGWTSMGYGIPDDNYPTDPNADSGSTVGRFFWNLVNKNHKLADVLTRGFIGFLMCLSGLVLPIVKSNWLMYLVGCLCIMVGQTVFSYRSLGEVKLGNKKLLVSDLVNYGLIGLGYLLMLK